MTLLTVNCELVTTALTAKTDNLRGINYKKHQQKLATNMNTGKYAYRTIANSNIRSLFSFRYVIVVVETQEIDRLNKASLQSPRIRCVAVKIIIDSDE